MRIKNLLRNKRIRRLGYVCLTLSLFAACGFAFYTLGFTHGMVNTATDALSVSEELCGTVDGGYIGESCVLTLGQHCVGVVKKTGVVSTVVCSDDDDWNWFHQVGAKFTTGVTMKPVMLGDGDTWEIVDE